MLSFFSCNSFSFCIALLEQAVLSALSGAATKT